MSRKPIIVFLEGPHCAGKTSILNELASRYHTIGENFLDFKPFADLEQQGAVNELLWMSNLIRKLSTIHEDITICDRSPYSVIPYCANGADFAKVCDAVREELDALYDIVTIYIQVDPKILYKRIKKRFQLLPGRPLLQENDMTHLRNVVQYYETAKWTYSLNNNNFNAIFGVIDIIEQLKRYP